MSKAPSQLPSKAVKHALGAFASMLSDRPVSDALQLSYSPAAALAMTAQ